MCLEQLHIVLRILFALARRLLRHFMFSRMVVRSRSSTPNSLVKRTYVNKMFGDDHCTWLLRWQSVVRGSTRSSQTCKARIALAAERVRRKQWRAVIENVAAFDQAGGAVTQAGLALPGS